MTPPVRAIASTELSRLRSNGQFSLLHMFIYSPPTIYTARVATFTSDQGFYFGSGSPSAAGPNGPYDLITHVTITSGSGSPINVKNGMTMWIGTSAGSSNKGIVRVRNFDGTTIITGESSDIAYAAGDYLTIIDDYFFWARRMAFDGSKWSIEGIPYYNQYNVCDPVPIIGPPVAILHLTGASIVFSPQGAADSWCVGSTIASYSWSFPGAASTTGLTTATPTATYNAAGTYRYSCTMTATNGATNTGHRLVYVWTTASPPISQFNLDSCTGQTEGEGWSFQVTMYNQASATLVKDRMLCVLFSEDYLGGVEHEQGPLVGYENILVEGWIDGESVESNPEQSKIQFTVLGPGGWLGKINNYPASVTNPIIYLQGSEGTATSVVEDWIWFTNMTIDAAIWHLLHWRSTVDSVIDVYPSGDTRHASACSAQMDSIWAQLVQFAGIHILANPSCNRFGQLIVEVDCQYLSVAERSAIPTVMALTKVDWEYAGQADSGLNLTRITSPVSGMTDADGYGYDTTKKVFVPFIARSGGFGLRPFGSVKTKSDLLFADQTQANSIAGLLQAKDNNEFPKLTFTLAAINRFFDVCPCQYLSLTVATDDTLQRVAFTAKRFIPRTISYQWDNSEQGGGMLKVTIDAEAEVFPENAVAAPMPLNPFMNGSITYTVPPNTPLPPVFPPVAPIAPPVYVPGTPVVPPPTNSCTTNMSAPANGPYDLAMMGDLYDAGAASVMYGYPTVGMWVRSSGHTNKTRVALYGTFEKTLDGGQTWVPDLDNTWYQFNAINDLGNVIATASWDTVTDQGTGIRWGTISLPAAAHAHLFQLVSITPSGSPLYYIYGLPINSGATPVITEGGVQMLMPDGSALDYLTPAFYALQGKANTGPWHNGILFNDSYGIQEGYTIPAHWVLFTLTACSDDLVPLVSIVPYDVGSELAIESGPEVAHDRDYADFAMDGVRPAGTQIWFLGSDHPKQYLCDGVVVGTDSAGGGWHSMTVGFPFSTIRVYDWTDDFAHWNRYWKVHMRVYSPVDYSPFGYGVHNDTLVVAPRNRIYFYASGVIPGNWARVDDTAGDFGDNTGAIDWELYHAGAAGDRHIRLGNVQIYNICGAPT